MTACEIFPCNKKHKSLKTNFSTSLAFHRLTVLGGEFIELEATTELLLTVGDVIEAKVEVDNS